MQLHIIGGFLGSGKTTAIVAAAQSLMARGKRVGIITNDQGKYLVDSSFVSKVHLPGVEVTGGCFCCNYDDLDQRLDQLIAAQHPDVIFAESVGSCADLVATVIKPLLSLRQASQTATSFSVFTDVRLLRLFLKGEELPFSDEVSYIFRKQIEEARLVILNKIDLLPAQAQRDLVALFQQSHPDKNALTQCSLAPEGVQPWLELISSGSSSLPDRSLEIDYQRYGRGEGKLAWVDEEFFLNVPAGAGRQAAGDMVKAVFQSLQERHVAVGHVKFLFEDGTDACKISLTTLEQAGWEDLIPEFKELQLHLLVNARVEMPAPDLLTLLEGAIRSTGRAAHSGAVDAFHPRQPVPTHRF